MTLYILPPGIYRGNFTSGFTNPANEGQRITIAGNPTASFFSGINAGPVIITNYSNNTTASGSALTIAKNFITLRDICLYARTAVGSPGFGIIVTLDTSSMLINRCYFGSTPQSGDNYTMSVNTIAGGVGPQITNCVFENINISLYGYTHSATWNSGTLVQDCIFTNLNTGSNTNQAIRLGSETTGQYGGVKIINSFLQSVTCISVAINNVSTTFPSLVQNCFFIRNNWNFRSDKQWPNHSVIQRNKRHNCFDKCSHISNNNYQCV